MPNVSASDTIKSLDDLISFAEKTASELRSQAGKARELALYLHNQGETLSEACMELEKVVVSGPLIRLMHKAAESSRDNFKSQTWQGGHLDGQAKQWDAVAQAVRILTGRTGT